MAPRKTIFACGATYHIFNRSLHKLPLFTNKKDFDLFLSSAKYYIQINPPVKYSIYRKQPDNYKLNFTKTLVKVIAYCFMPNHYHLILTQLENNGIHTFIHRLSSSYAHYFNIKNEKRGPVFEDRFKAVRVESQEQLIHLSRYIHLNPVTSYITENPSDYEYSSYNYYINKDKNNFVDWSDVMVSFKSSNDYKKFVLNQKDYQRSLNNIYHLVFE